MIFDLPHDPEIDNRNAHMVAVKAMMSKPPHPEEDDESVVWAGVKRAPDDAQDWVVGEMAAAIGRDAILIVFDSLRGSAAPRGFTVVAKRDGKLGFWPGCQLWAPPSGGPALLMARDGGSFGWDGRLLVHSVRRPVAVIDHGVVRARLLLRRAVGGVTAEEAGTYARAGIVPEL